MTDDIVIEGFMYKDLHLCSDDLILYAILWKYRFEKTPTIAEIAVMIGISERTIYRVLCRLKRFGYIGKGGKVFLPSHLKKDN